LEVRARFDESKGDSLENMIRNSGGTQYSESRLVYFVKKYDPVGSGINEFEKSVYVEYPNNAVIGKRKKKNLFRISYFGYHHTNFFLSISHIISYLLHWSGG
jgi:hypothetical protein